MSEMMNQIYSFDEDGILRLQKDLNYMFQHLDDNNVRRLFTEYCDIKSEAGETEIDGPLLIMRGDPGTTNSTTVRIRMGWNKTSSEFEFNIYGSSGAPSIELNSTGEIVNRGNINTAKDIYVGNRVFVGWGASTELPAASLTTRGIYIMKPGTTEYAASVQSTYTTDFGGVYEFRIQSSAPMQIRAENTLEINQRGGFPSVNSSDYLKLYSYNSRLFLNANPAGIIGQGVFIGGGYYRGYGEVYLQDDSYWGYRVPTVRELECDYSQDLAYFYSHNQRFIAKPTTDWTLYSTDTTLYGSTIFVASTRGCGVVAETTNSAVINFGCYSTVASLDLTQFHDGTALTSNDYLVLVVYHASTAYVLYDAVRLGNVGNYYTYSFTSFNAGWNIQKLKLGAYAGVTGTPNFNNIDWVEFFSRLSSAVSRPAGVVVSYFDYLGIIRAHSTDSSRFSAFQRDKNSTHREVFVQTYDNDFIDSYAGKPCLMQTGIGYSYSYNNEIRQYNCSFKAKLTAHAQRFNRAPTLSFAGLVAEFGISARVSSGVLRLFGQRNGTTFSDYIYCPAFDAFTDIEMGLERKCIQGLTTDDTNEVYRCWFRISTDPSSYREITKWSGVSTHLAYGKLYLGNDNFDCGMKITELITKPYNDYNLDYE